MSHTFISRSGLAALIAGGMITPVAAEIDEIIIQTTKRERLLQEVPVAVSAYSSEQLNLASVTNIESLVSISPSLTVASSNTETGGSTFRLRGIGTTGNNAGLEGAVGVFLDGVYLSRPGVAFTEFNDIQQIEVMRGPQGTLFGRNTSSGAISIRTKKPSFDNYEAEAAATISNYDGRVVSIGANLPASDELAFRLAGIYNEHDGYIESINGFDSVDRDRYAFRGQALWAPTDKFDIRVIGDYLNADDEKCCDAVIKFDRGHALGAPGGNPLGSFPGVGFDSQLSALGLPFIGPNALGGTIGGLGDGRAEPDGVSVAGDLDSRLTNANRPSLNGQEQWGISSEINYDFGPAKLTYVGGYRDFGDTSAADLDFTSNDILYSDGQYTDIETMSHEVRFQGNHGIFDWLVGGYFSDEKIKRRSSLSPGDDYAAYAQSFIDVIQASAFAGAFTGADGSSSFGTILPNFASLVTGPGAPTIQSAYASGAATHNDFEQDSQSWSLFTHNVVSLTDKLDLTAGMRYIHESKEGKFNQTTANVAGCANAAPALAALRAEGGGGFFDDTSAANPMSAAASGVHSNGKSSLDELYEVYVAFSCFPLFSPVVPEFDQDFDDDALTGIVNLSYELTDDLLIYGSYSRGFKAGGFNLDPTAAIADSSNPFASASFAATPVIGDASFKSETVDAYEIGFKGSFFDNRLQTNIAIFHMDVDDIQILEFNGVQFIVENVESAKSTGFEFEAMANPIDGLDLNASVTFADARYPSDVGASDPGSVASKVAGRPLTFAPKWVLGGGATYTKDIPSTPLSAFIHFDYRYDSARLTGTTPASARLNFTPTDDEVPNAKRQGGAGKLNLRGGLGDQDDRWSVEMWARNVFNETTTQIYFGIPLRGGATGAFLDDPRTYGLTLKAKFN